MTVTTTKSSSSTSSVLDDIENTIKGRIKELQNAKKNPALSLTDSDFLTIKIETLHWVLAEILSLKSKSSYST